MEVSLTHIPRDVLIPEQLRVSPHTFHTVENEWSRFDDVDPRRFWISAEGESWLKARESGESLDDLVKRINADGLRYRRGAIEKFFLLVEAALVHGWREASDKVLREWVPRTVLITPDGVSVVQGGNNV